MASGKWWKIRLKQLLNYNDMAKPLSTHYHRWTDEDRGTVVDMLSKGYCVREIAEAMGKTFNSIDTMIERMLETYECHNRIQLCCTLIRLKIIE